MEIGSSAQKCNKLTFNMSASLPGKDGDDEDGFGNDDDNDIMIKMMIQ